METFTKKRVRSSNWEEEEKRLLIHLVTERIDLIENKDTSTNTNTLKKAAWQEVLSRFNSLNSRKRNLTQLLNQWRNTKGKVKSREFEYQHATLKTGKGPPPPSPPAEDPIQNEFAVDSNNFDSNSEYMKTTNQSQTSESSNDYEPKTPVPSSSNEIVESEDEIQIQEDQKKTDAVSVPMRRGCKPVKKSNKKINNYEEELFLLVKKSKEREMERAEELHRKRMIILNLEEEYWRNKIKKE